ncbi:MAG: GHMP kinase [Saprospiraceae bacterium]|nr:GHMP kinase [Saprospiraceae bacterium]
MTHTPTAFKTHTKGKLLLTGEYVVLDGANALAIPAKLGQQLEVKRNEEVSPGFLNWSSYDHTGQIWFQASFQLAPLQILSTTDTATAERIIQIFQSIQRQKPEAWKGLPGLEVRMDLQFSRHWGLGTSSTLLAALAQWQKIDPYQLLWDSFGGSAYDIACAIADGPILYQLDNGMPHSTPTPFHPPFAHQLYLVYSGKKQNSREGIRHYRQKFASMSPAPLIRQIDALTQAILKSTQLEEFEQLIAEHEALIGDALSLVPVLQQDFNGYWGQIKSLGAWGGDFILVTSDRSAQTTANYFADKGLTEIFPFTEWLLL